MMTFISSKLSLYVLPHDTVHDQKTLENMPGEAQINTESIQRQELQAR